MDYSAPGFPVLLYLQEFAQTHVHWVDDTIQPYNPLSSTSPPALNISQNQGLFQWVSSLHQVAKVWSFSFSISSSDENSNDFLYGWLVWSPCYPRDTQESSPTSKFKRINSLALSLLCGSTLTFIHDCRKNHSFDYRAIVSKVMSLLFNTLSGFVIAFLPRSNVF